MTQTTEEKNGPSLDPRKRIEDRVMRVSIDPRQVFELFRQGSKKLIIEGVPDDAQYIGTGYDAISNTWQMFCTHPSFKEVPASHQVPQLVCTINFEPL